MIYAVDIDGTIAATVGNDYYNSISMPDKIAKINKLYDEGHTIIYWTSRGNTSGEDWLQFTMKQLEIWGCKYHQLKLGKLSYDIIYDDKSRIL